MVVYSLLGQPLLLLGQPLLLLLLLLLHHPHHHAREQEWISKSKIRNAERFYFTYLQQISRRRAITLRVTWFYPRIWLKTTSTMQPLAGLMEKFHMWLRDPSVSSLLSLGEYITFHLQSMTHICFRLKWGNLSEPSISILQYKNWRMCQMGSEDIWRH